MHCRENVKKCKGKSKKKRKKAMDAWVTFFGRTTYIQRIVGNTHKFLDNKLSLSLSLIKAITQYKKLRSSTIRPRLWSRNDLSIFREIIQDSAIYSLSKTTQSNPNRYKQYLYPT